MVTLYQKYIAFDKKENSIGKDIVHHANIHNLIIEDYPLKERVHITTQYLHTLISSRFNLYKVYVLEENSVNAMASPGGYIFLTTGLLELVYAEEITFDELTGIIAHEIGHIELKHHRSLMLEKFKQQYINGVIVAQTGGHSLSHLGIKGMMHLFNNSMTRKMEFEADDFATHVLQKSNIPSYSLLHALIKLEEFSGFPKWAEILFSHPHMDYRIINIDKILKGIS